MTNCVRCVQSIEADPQNVTKLFHSFSHLQQDISPAHHPRRSEAAKFITSDAYQEWYLYPWVLGCCCLLLYGSISSRKEQASSRPIFYSSIIGRGPYHSNIYPGSSHRKYPNFQSILVVLWPLERPFLYWLVNLRIAKHVVLHVLDQT